MSIIRTQVEGMLQAHLLPPLASIVYGYAESDQERIQRIRAVLQRFEEDLNETTQLNVVAGTRPTGQEPESAGGQLPFQAMESYGLTVQCPFSGVVPASTFMFHRLFKWLATDSEITSFAVEDGWFPGVDEAIADCLRKNRTLQILDIPHTGISKGGILKILDALRDNSSLLYLNIRANDIDNTTLMQMSEILKTNRTLSRFSFTQNNFIKEKNLDPSLIQQIDVQLKANAQAQGFSAAPPRLLDQAGSLNEDDIFTEEDEIAPPNQSGFGAVPLVDSTLARFCPKFWY